jgi:hypothetical protein
MNNRFVFLALATVSLTLSAPLSFANTVSVYLPSLAVSQSDKPTIDVSKVLIGSLKLGMTEKQVTRLLGKSSNIKREKDNGTCSWNTSTTMEYRNLEIFITDGSVASISTTSKSYPTNEGIRVGDPISKAKKIYGRKFSSEDLIRNPEQYSLAYVNDAYGGLSFRANQQGKITEIALSAASC